MLNEGESVEINEIWENKYSIHRGRTAFHEVPIILIGEFMVEVREAISNYQDCFNCVNKNCAVLVCLELLKRESWIMGPI